MGKRSVVLLSGGLDSVVAGALSLRVAHPTIALTANYGQRAFEAENKAAAYFAELWGCEHKIVSLEWLGELSKSPLTDTASKLPSPDLGNTAQTAASGKTAWVPARNLVLAAVAAAYTDASGSDTIVAGWNAEEASTFPDNSAGFAAALDIAISRCAHHSINLFLPLLGLTKTDILRKAIDLGIEIDHTYSCWGAGPLPCGRCESCLRIARARMDVLCTG